MIKTERLAKNQRALYKKKPPSNGLRGFEYDLTFGALVMALADFTVEASEMQELESLRDELSTIEGRALLVLWGYEQGARGDCRAKAETIGIKLNRDKRSIKRYLSRLTSLGLLVKRTKRMRYSIRTLTHRGRLLARLLSGERFKIIPTRPASPLVSPHLSPHNGKADPTPKDSLSAVSYVPKRQRGSLAPALWVEIARWMDESGSMSSYSRCKIAHRAFKGLRGAIERSAEWKRYRLRDRVGYAEELIYLAVQDARRVGARFGTVESALAYIGRIVEACMIEHRTPRPACFS